MDRRQGSPIVNLKGTKNYDPSRPEGALIYKKADDATYTTHKLNKKTGEMEEVTVVRKTNSTKM